ncbi:MAG: hypothetical protein H7Z40_21100 [Phycisphaerae bacterium]|nr:hypothetical protein [Gemmatimonadaceae bacterium]
MYTGATDQDVPDHEANQLPRRGRDVLHFERIVVIGGGCYGSWYTRQLVRARAAGSLTVSELVVVDRNPACQVISARDAGEFPDVPLTVVTSTWSDYLTQWLQGDAATLQGHALVPSPLMPHLLLDWLVARAIARWPQRTVTVEPLSAAPRIPWERGAPDGRHYVSFAEWMCPINCIEPVLCPATGGPRSWSMPFALQAYVNAHQAAQGLKGPVIFHCVHRTHGVGMIDASAIAEADSQIATWGASAPARVLVGTVSHCHGALGVLAAL